MSTRREQRRQDERRARALKARHAAVSPKAKPSLFRNLSADWIVGGIIGAVVLIIAAVFAAAYFFGPGRSSNPTFAQVFSVAISPASPKRALLGDASGLFLSNDGGKKWTPHTLTEPIRKVYFDPNKPGIVYAVGGNSIERSTDAGDTWTKFSTNLPTGPVTAMASDPADSARLYAFVSGQGLLKSEDGGTAWTRQNNLPAATLTSLAIKAGAPDTIYAFHDADGFVVSIDNGRRFDSLGGPPLPKKAVSDILTFAQEPNTIFVAADQGVYKSSDGGASWTKLDSSGIHGVPVVALSRDASGGKLYAANTAGELYVSADGGDSWQKNNPS